MCAAREAVANEGLRPIEWVFLHAVTEHDEGHPEAISIIYNLGEADYAAWRAGGSNLSALNIPRRRVNACSTVQTLLTVAEADLLLKVLYSKNT